MEKSAPKLDDERKQLRGDEGPRGTVPTEVMSASVRKAPRPRLRVEKLRSDEQETTSVEATTVKQFRGV